MKILAALTAVYTAFIVTACMWAIFAPLTFFTVFVPTVLGIVLTLAFFGSYAAFIGMLVSERETHLRVMMYKQYEKMLPLNKLIILAAMDKEFQYGISKRRY